MKILYLTLANIDDRSFGGAIRGNDIRDALLALGTVHTLVVQGGHEARLEPDWDEREVRHATLNRSGASPAALAQRWRVRRWVARTVAGGDYDIIVARYLGLALYVPFGRWRRLVLDADDIFKSGPAGEAPAPLTKAKLRLRNALAAALLGFARHAWFVNPQDASRAGRRGSSLLGNAIAMPPLQRLRAKPVPGRLLMVGFFEHPPNAEGLRWFASNVLPALRAQDSRVELHAVGRHSAALADDFAEGVRLRGHVADLAAEYDQACIVIAPIFSGGGTQIKVIDALAHARPLVASAFTQAGFAPDLCDERDLLVASADPAAWIAQCMRLLADPALGARLGEAGCAAVRTRYGTEHLAEQVARTLQPLARELRKD
jgi:hypothetical protein